MSTLHRFSPEPDFDVKIVGGKRMVIWKQPINSNSGGMKKSRSLSALDHISDDHHRRSLAVLPPIRQTENFLDSNPEYDVNLWREIHSILKNYNEKQLILIMDELKKRNIGEQRLTTPKILAAIAAQYQLPIPPYMLKILCERFAITLAPISVQFESLLNYLINCKNQLPPNADFSPINSRPSSFSSLSSVSSLSASSRHQLEPIHKNKENIQNAFFAPNFHSRVRDETHLIEQLSKELADDDMRLDLFRRHAYELDSGRRGVLSKPQIERLLTITNITVDDELLTQILSFCDKQGYGLYDLTVFLSFFERAVVQDQTLFQPSQRKIIRPRTPNIQFGPLPSVQYVSTNAVPHPISATQFSPNFMPHPVSATEFSLNLVPHPVSATQFSLNLVPLLQEEWLSRYDRLVFALRSSSDDERGYLPTNETLHIVDNFNIVYNLQIEASDIQKAVNYAGRNYPGFISIESFANHLRELHLNRNYWNKF